MSSKPPVSSCVYWSTNLVARRDQYVTSGEKCLARSGNLCGSCPCSLLLCHAFRPRSASSTGPYIEMIRHARLSFVDPALQDRTRNLGLGDLSLLRLS